MVVLPLGLLALGILGCILCFDDEIEQIFAGGVVNRNQHASVQEDEESRSLRESADNHNNCGDADRNQDVSVQEDGESIPLREIADNHNNRGNEAQDEEDSSFE